jgi:hypothetical protein
VDSAHPLLKTIWVPRDVVVEENVADLKVNTLPGSLCGHENLDVPVLELLLGV